MFFLNQFILVIRKSHFLKNKIRKSHFLIESLIFLCCREYRVLGLESDIFRVAVKTLDQNQKNWDPFFGLRWSTFVFFFKPPLRPVFLVFASHFLGASPTRDPYFLIQVCRFFFQPPTETPFLVYVGIFFGSNPHWDPFFKSFPPYIGPQAPLTPLFLVYVGVFSFQPLTKNLFLSACFPLLSPNPHWDPFFLPTPHWDPFFGLCFPFSSLRSRFFQPPRDPFFTIFVSRFC